MGRSGAEGVGERSMVSIVMPAYNAGRYIEEAIDSVLNQTYKNWELIVVDDCSRDNTRQILDRYISQYSNIHYYKNEHNLGSADTRNLGVSVAAGEWIAYLDSDDCWHPDKLQLQMELAEKTQAEFLFTGSAFIDEESRPLDYFLPAPEKVSYQELLKQNVVSCSSVLIRKELAEEYPMKQASRLHEDFAVWLQILRDKKICAYGVNQPLLVYRISSKSKSGNKVKAAKMTFRVYRYLGLSFGASVYYWMFYFVRSLRKYSKLKF